jgi:hypothetical protein
MEFDVASNLVTAAPATQEAESIKLPISREGNSWQIWQD